MLDSQECTQKIPNILNSNYSIVDHSQEIIYCSVSHVVMHSSYFRFNHFYIFYVYILNLFYSFE